ncbi:MAG: hypothetical protein QM706_15910 [Nitrospira sp.]
MKLTTHINAPDLVRLRRRLFPHDDTTADFDKPSIKIYVPPLEPDQFAHPQSGPYRAQQDGVQRRATLGLLQQQTDFFRGQRLDVLPFVTRRFE